MSTEDAAGSAPFANGPRTALYQETAEPTDTAPEVSKAQSLPARPVPAAASAEVPSNDPVTPASRSTRESRARGAAWAAEMRAARSESGADAVAPGKELAVTPAPAAHEYAHEEPLSGAVMPGPLDSTPAQWGRRARIRRLSGGVIRPAPSVEELDNRRAVTTIRQATWIRAVDVLVANPKGGTGKTPAALILAGILGQLRGGYVVAWEACESIGSLGRRAEGQPARGLAELLAGVADVRSAGNLGGYVAPQTSHADVIGSVAQRAVLTARDVVALRRVLDTYYRIQITDSGNNPGHEAFSAALQTADAVVLPCLVSIDSLAGVQEALTAIHSSGRAGLGSRVVIVLGHDGGPEDPGIAAAIRARLHTLGVAAVLEVPFDPAIRLGGEITLSALSQASIRAWTVAAAAVVQSLRSAHTGTDLVRDLYQRLQAGGPGATRSINDEEISQ